MDFVEICNVYARKMIIKAAKRIFNSDKICRSYSDLNFGVTFFGTQCIVIVIDIAIMVKSVIWLKYNNTDNKFICIVCIKCPLMSVVARRGAKGDILPGRHCAGGGIWRGKNMQKYAILKFGRFWRIGVCIAGRIRILFTVHTNVIIVTMLKISIGDLIAGVGAATKTFAPGCKHPCAITV